MATGSLIKIDKEIVTSAVASVTLLGIDSTYDVYMVKFNNVTPDTDIVNLYSRFTVSGSADTSSNYDRAFVNLSADITFPKTSGTNASFVDMGLLGTGSNEQSNGILYLFNFNNASEYSFCTLEQSFTNNDGNLRGFQGGAVLTVAQSTNGINFFMSSGNIDTGSKFTLYGLKK